MLVVGFGYQILFVKVVEMGGLSLTCIGRHEWVKSLVSCKESAHITPKSSSE